MFSPGRPAQVEKHGELERLTREGVITFTTAMLYATNAGNLRVQMADVADDEQSLITA